ncbi:MAG TPA: GMC family oxidoreductase [Sandaracinaceae bacterium LLY-WYZ-13_1]|nr:GMC family oxidoreductase [Sandaracinaceae bacterium LLY-WYZ-13_1]
MTRLSPPERFTFLRIAEAATPPGEHVPLPDARTIDNVERLLSRFGPTGLHGYRAMLRALDLAAIPLTGSRLSTLPPDRREATLVRLAQREATFWFVRAVTAPMKIAQAQADEVEAALGASDGYRLPVTHEAHRWEARITDGGDLDADEEIDADVVVVGTGAGGAPVARALAARGHAVVVLEAGRHFTRTDFVGRPLEQQAKLYENGGATGTLGNTVIPVPMGRTVGGSTTVNSGTCYRTPDSTLRRWQLELGLHALGPGSLEPYFERVETAIEVEEAQANVLGGVARVIGRGAEALGYEHGPLRRNAPGCDGQAVCCFGCPTDAKRSTNVSYVPQARAGGEGGVRLTVRARAVVLACGTMHTPSLLLRQRLANGSDQVGRNLTIHPASQQWAAFDEPIRGFEEIPQGYAVEEFADQGIRFEGGFLPLSMAAGALGQVGRQWTELVDAFDRLACFGFMIAETSRGRVVLGPGGRPTMRYSVNDTDMRRIVQAHAILARIYLAGGANVVYPGMQIFDRLGSEEDVARLEREGPGRLRPHHVDLTAYHPLGTCRMGADPARSVIGPTQETWDVPGLFVCDGSAVPGPLGVNPQVTIMALSERAAQFVERRVEEGARVRAAVPEGPAVAFEETMSGLCQLEPDEGGGSVDVSFTVRAVGGLSLERAIRQRGGQWTLDGTITVDGVATERPCRGLLVMRPLRRRATLVYDLDFEDDDGTACTLHGEKHTRLGSALRGMTTLHTELRREGFRLGRGILTFDLDDLSPWLASFRLLAEAAAEGAGSDESEPPEETAAPEGPAAERPDAAE